MPGIRRWANGVVERPTVRLGLLGISIVGYAVCLQSLLAHGIYGYGGAGGGDVFAYWTAARHFLDGQPLYAVGVGGPAAFLYPPLFVQVIAPLGLLPFPIAVWTWRAMELLCLRVAVGSWRNAGLAMFYLPVIAELDAGNVHLAIAAVVALAMRGHAAWLGPGAVLKFASLAAIPVGLRADTRGTMTGLALGILAVALSVVLAAQLWRDYVAFMVAIPDQDYSWYDLGRSIPILPRLIVAGAVGIGAMRWRRLAGLAATLALPVLWFHGLAVMVAALSPLPHGTFGRSDAADAFGRVGTLFPEEKPA